MRGEPGNVMASDRPRAASGSLPACGRARRAAQALALSTATLLGLSAASSTARADVADQPGQPAGVAIQAALFACSAVSIGGNAANIAMKNPQRGWMYSGFICGFINTIVSPVVLIYFRNPEPVYGVTTGAVHGALGVTNLGLAIYNGVLWHRARIAGQEPPRVALLPFVGRDQLGATVAGLSLRVARF